MGLSWGAPSYEGSPLLTSVSLMKLRTQADAAIVLHPDKVIAIKDYCHVCQSVTFMTDRNSACTL